MEKLNDENCFVFFCSFVVQRFRDKRELIDRINMYRDKIK